MENVNWKSIVNDFNNGCSILSLTKKYNLAYSKINNYLVKNGYKKINHCKVSNDICELAKLDLINGMYLSDAKEKYNLSISALESIVRENNIKVNIPKKQRDKFNINFNDSYFSNINTEEKAYFLGLIYTDGNVRKHDGGYFLNIELNIKDEYIIEKLKQELNCGNKISHRNRTTNMGKITTARFETCNSKQIFDDLGKFGVIPNKTYNSISFKNINELIPRELRKHFLRGLIDGDGSITNRLSDSNENSIGYIHMHKECCEYFDKILKDLINDDLFDYTIYYNCNHLYNIRYRRINDVKKICELLYKDSCIYLERKFNRAKLYFDEEYYKSQASDSFLLCSNT